MLCCRRHVVGQQVVSDISLVVGVFVACVLNLIHVMLILRLLILGTSVFLQVQNIALPTTCAMYLVAMETEFSDAERNHCPLYERCASTKTAAFVYTARASMLARSGVVIILSVCSSHACFVTKPTSSSAMAERPRELDQRFQMGVNLRLL